MTTLIEVRNSDGVIGRCDAKCYTATNDKCNCICGGKNHGAGLDQAIINTRTMVDNWIKDYKQKNNLDDSVKVVIDESIIHQMSIFDLIMDKSMKQERNEK